MICNREVRMKEVIKYLIDLWSKYKFDEKEPPLMFSDSFAKAMFFGRLLKTVKRFYKIGIKDERKRRKYSKKQNSKSPQAPEEMIPNCV